MIAPLWPSQGVVQLPGAAAQASGFGLCFLRVLRNGCLGIVSSFRGLGGSCDQHAKHVWCGSAAGVDVVLR